MPMQPERAPPVHSSARPTVLPPTLPPNLFLSAPQADGDYPLILNLGSFSTPAGGYLTVKN